MSDRLSGVSVFGATGLRKLIRGIGVDPAGRSRMRDYTDDTRV
jgi:hypothetical protein